MKYNKFGFFMGISLMLVFSFVCPKASYSQIDIDKKVRLFLDTHKRSGGNMNVPYEDGQLLYKLVLKNKYTRALEIGTSTGHSTIWIAWALSKTGGKLITIEINETRYKQALKNIKEAGLEDFVEARLADAHELVPELEGPFDFVFSDADKYWYKQYFLDLDPKLEINGCYSTHNVSERQNQQYLRFLQDLPHYSTTVDNKGGGLAISYKKSEK